MKILVAQIGAREHYAAACALHRRGALAGLVTDWYAPGALGFLKCLGRAARSALAARAEELPDQLVKSMPLRKAWWRWKIRRAARNGRLYDGYAQTDSAFAQAVARMRLPAHEIFFGYAYGSLEMLEAEKRRGVFTVLCQIDPGPLHHRVVADEMRRHPELAGPPPEFPADYFARVRREWQLADVIVANSEWTRQSIIAEGADPAKIEILPLAFEPTEENAPPENFSERRQNGGPLTVLWLGAVAPAKGIYYLVKAARLLGREAVPAEILVAGAQHVRPEFVAGAPANVRWLGAVPRSETRRLYQQADVFVLPTLSDGFALTQLEALAAGVPVITTPNCGRVVADGRTGFIVPPRDAAALAAAIKRFCDDRDLSARMSPLCREAVKPFSIDAFGNGLVEIITKRFSPPPAKNFA